MTTFTKDGKISVNSITIPPQFVAICTDWYGGQDCMLYAVCSTGGLTTGTNCPVIDYTNELDRKRKHYLTIWRGLSADVGYAERLAHTMLERSRTDCDGCDDESYDKDWLTLSEFEEWIDDTVIPALDKSYGLEDWEG